MDIPSEKDSQTLTVEVGVSVTPQRLDSYLGRHPDLKLTRSRAQRLIEDGLVLVNGRQVAKKYQIQAGDVISVTLIPRVPIELKGEDIPLDIVYEDNYLAVVNKPAGMVTHPGLGNYSRTLVNAMIYHFEKLSHGSAVHRPGVVHRLDKNTSGLLLIAKEDDVYLKLQKALKTREIRRTYLALVCGHLKDEEGTIELPIGRSLKSRKKMAVTYIASREAKTSYKLLKRYRSYDLIEADLHTGRTHQIRVHFSHIGHPVLGDPDYGGRQKWHRGLFGPERPLANKLLAAINRQALHAKRLEFVHPVMMDSMAFESEPPEDFRSVLELLDREGA